MTTTRCGHAERSNLPTILICIAIIGVACGFFNITSLWHSAGEDLPCVAEAERVAVDAGTGWDPERNRAAWAKCKADGSFK